MFFKNLFYSPKIILFKSVKSKKSKKFGNPKNRNGE